jgi:hypothetical protein
MKLTLQDNVYLLPTLKYNNRMRGTKGTYSAFSLRYRLEVMSRDSFEDALESIFEFFKYNGDDIVQFLDKALYAESKKVLKDIFESSEVDEEDIEALKDLGTVEEEGSIFLEARKDFKQVLEELKSKEPNN